MEERKQQEAKNETQKRTAEYYSLLDSIHIEALDTIDNCDKADAIICKAKEIFAKIEGCEDTHTILAERVKEKRVEINSSVGLSILQNKNLRDEFVVKSIKDIANRIDQTRRKCKWDSIPDTEYAHIKTALERIYSTLKEKEKKEWLAFDSKVWKTIQLWVPSDLAQCWFNEIVTP